MFPLYCETIYQRFSTLLDSSKMITNFYRSVLQHIVFILKKKHLAKVIIVDNLALYYFIVLYL
jgi:hypothetical protein